MIVLGFEHDAALIDGARVRAARFERRSALPVSAACVVANGVREMLGELIADTLSLRLLAPLIPDAPAWRAISEGARMFGAPGPLADAVFVLRENDAATLARAAFGEMSAERRDLSAIETQVLERAVRALAGALSPVCGFRETPLLERIASLVGYTTYFELLIDRPFEARIGVALSREPKPDGGGGVSIDDLYDMPLEVSARFARATLRGRDILTAVRGTQLNLRMRLEEPAVLAIGETIIARGVCGIIGTRNAFTASARESGR